MNIFLKVFLGICFIGAGKKAFDEIAAKKMIREYQHTPEFEKLLNHYSRQGVK